MGPVVAFGAPSGPGEGTLFGNPIVMRANSILLAAIALAAGCAGPVLEIHSRPILPGSKEDRLSTDLSSPGARALYVGPEYFRRIPALLEYRLDAPGSVDRVILYVSTDGGGTWTLAGESRDGVSPIEFRAADGEYGIWITAQIQGGPPADQPLPKEGPGSRIVLDTQAPEMELRDPRALRTLLAKEPASIDVRIPFAVRDANLDPASLRLEWKAGAGRWNGGYIDAAALQAGEAAIRVPESVQEPLAVRITAADRAGNVTIRSESIHPLDLVDPARLSILSIQDSTALRSGAVEQIRVRADWDRLAPGGLSLAFSPDGGKTWKTVESGIDPAAPCEWTVPAGDTDQGILELSARGTCGYRAVERSRTFRIDSQPPVARIIGPRFSARKTVALSISARDSGPAGLDRLVLYEDASGGEPRKVKEFGPASTIEYQASRTGEIGLWLVAIDKAGNRSPLPLESGEAPFLLQIDPRGSALTLLSFAGGGIFRGGTSRYIFMEGSDEFQDRPLRIDLAEGPDGPWSPVAEGLTFRQRYLWKLPELTAEGLRLRVEVTDRGGDVVRTVGSVPFAIDSTAPRSSVESAEVLADGTTRIRFAASDAPAGVARVWIWIRSGGSWQKHPSCGALPEGEAEGSMSLDLQAGRHGLYAAGEDWVGNVAPAPDRQEDAQAWVEVPARIPPAAVAQGAVESPRITLTNFHGGTFRGGDRKYVFWQIAGVRPEGALVDILASKDGGTNWEPIASDLGAAEGRWAWTIPQAPGTAQKVLLEVRARAGAEAFSARSGEPFIVECRMPRAEFRGPKVSRGTRTSIRYAILPPDGAGPQGAGIEPTDVVAVECHIRRQGEDTWVFAGRKVLGDGAGGAKDAAAGAHLRDVDMDEPAEAEPEDEPGEIAGAVLGTLTAFIEDGRFEVALIPEDAVGNRPPLPAPGSVDPSRRTLVDTVPPRLKVDVRDPKDIYGGGELMELAIRAEDENLGEFPVRIEMAEGQALLATSSAPTGASQGEAAGGSAHGPALRPALQREEDWTVLEPLFPRSRTFAYRIPRIPGERRLRVSAQDLAGNRSEEVLRFTVTPPRPGLVLQGLDRPLALRGGEPLVIRWETTGVEPEQKAVNLRWSRDGGRTWEEAARDIPNTGLYTWTTPRDDVEDLRIRLEAAGVGGQSASAESASITVSVRAPRVVLDGVVPAAPGASGDGGRKTSEPSGGGKEREEKESP